MKDKGLESEITLSSTPGFVEPDDKPLNQSNNQAKKVDINETGKATIGTIKALMLHKKR